MPRTSVGKNLRTLAGNANRAAMVTRIERAIRAELNLHNIAIRDAFPMFLNIGDIVRILIRDHLRDYGYAPGEIELGPESPCSMPFLNEPAHDVLMTLAVAGKMDWRVDEHLRIHFWRTPAGPTTEGELLYS